MLNAGGHFYVLALSQDDIRLFLCTNTPEWRTRADGEQLVRRAGTPTPGNQLDLAAVATLRHTGTVYAVPADVDAPPSAVSLQPFVEPHQCLAQIAPATAPAEQPTPRQRGEKGLTP